MSSGVVGAGVNHDSAVAGSNSSKHPSDGAFTPPATRRHARGVPFWLFAVTTACLVSLHFAPELIGFAQDRFGPSPLLSKFESALTHGAVHEPVRGVATSESLARATSQDATAGITTTNADIAGLQQAYQAQVQEQQRLASMITNLAATVASFDQKFAQDSGVKAVVIKMESDLQTVRQSLESAQKEFESTMTDRISSRLLDSAASTEARLTGAFEPVLARLDAVETSLKALSDNANRARADRRSISILPVLLMKLAQTNSLDKVDIDRLELYFADDPEFNRLLMNLKSVMAANPKPFYVLRDEFKSKLAEASSIARTESVSFVGRIGLWLGDVAYFFGVSEKRNRSVSELALIAGLESLDRGKLAAALFELEPLGRETKLYLGRWYVEAKQRLAVDETLEKIQDRLYTAVDRMISLDMGKTK